MINEENMKVYKTASYVLLLYLYAMIQGAISYYLLGILGIIISFEIVAFIVLIGLIIILRRRNENEK